MLFKPMYEELLGKELPEPNESGEIKINCPFHSDSNPSMSVNMDTGAWYCFTCAEGGNFVDFIMEKEGLTRVKARKFIDEKWPDLMKEEKGSAGKKTDVPPIEEAEVQKWHQILKNSKKVMEWLLTERGITPETVNRFKLGWDGERITIPIRDQEGYYRNIRRYKPRGSTTDKVISYKAGYGSARLFPVENLVADKILICEGEMDCILANQLGYHAITATGGAGSWKAEWNKLFADKEVFIVYDIDDEGKKGAERVARQLVSWANIVKIVELPIVKPDNADVTDYWVKYGHTKEDMDKLITSTDIYTRTSRKTREQDTKEYQVHLSQASRADYYYKNISANVIVAGKDLAPFLIPKKISISCGVDSGDKACMFCSVRVGGGATEYIIDEKDPGLLQLINCTEQQQKGFIKARAGIPKKCGRMEIEVLESQNIEEIMMMPELDFSDEEREYVIRRAFYVGHGLQPNASYTMKGITCPDPWNQYAIHLIHAAIPSQDNIASFEMSPEKKERLLKFQPKEGQTVEEKFDDIHQDLTYNITHIYGREDVLTAMDLIYHSVLAFNFEGQRVHRGWVEGLIIGDTRTGKSETAQALQKHYKLGELVTGENTSYAGLIGGMQQANKRWSITWGKVPLNDRRLVVLDEASGLSEDTIAQMSGVRSSGIAEITKIQTEKTHSRTRLAWISNSRDGRALKEHGYGIFAIKRLIGKSEDIARFEFALTCASEEVPMELINKKIELHGEYPHKYDWQSCKELILWAWSRSPDQIVFHKSTVNKILKLATEMGEIYSSRIPLVEGANQRIKLARLAVSVAARVFSTDEKGEKLVVKPEHAEYAHKYLEHCYQKPSMGYWDFSRKELEDQQIAEEKKKEVMLFLDQNEELGELFLQYESATASDIEFITDTDREEAKTQIKFLAKNRMVRKTSHGFRKTPPFSKILKDWKEERKNGNRLSQDGSED